MKGFKVAANPVDSGAESQYLKRTLIVLKTDVSIRIHVSMTPSRFDDCVFLLEVLHSALSLPLIEHFGGCLRVSLECTCQKPWNQA